MGQTCISGQLRDSSKAALGLWASSSPDQSRFASGAFENRGLRLESFIARSKASRVGEIERICIAGRANTRTDFAQREARANQSATGGLTDHPSATYTAPWPRSNLGSMMPVRRKESVRGAGAEPLRFPILDNTGCA
jgi:hypothetical protein